MRGNNFVPSIAAVIVNYNGGEVLPDAVKTLRQSDYKALEIIVVDNNSKDGSITDIINLHDDLIIIQNAENLGFAKGCNQGLEKSAEIGAPYTLFLNSDATVDNRTLSELSAFLNANPKAAAVSPYIFYAGKPDIIWYGGAKAALWRGWIAHEHIRIKYRADEHKPRRTGYLSGCIFLARTDALVDAGGFSEDFILYSEDVDLSLRLKKAGWQLWVLPEAHSYHKVSQSAGGELSPFKAYHRGRSMAVLYKKHLHWALFPLMIIGGFIGGVLVSLKLALKGKISTVFAFWFGFVSGFSEIGVPVKYRLKN